MAGNLQQRLDSLKSKAKLLSEQHAKLTDYIRVADQRIAELQATVERQQAQISVLSQKIEHLQVVSTLAPNHEDVEKSRKFLAELLRDIDKCISELSE
ncbi:MAG: hypothetical protein NC111_03165 [Bacteroides sp.]|nr:hypothetical protein [Bacteroides sp.]MCM1412851.1 hypothetical protein [Bacteroides sp.]MCM1471520.1 hypothetical protein [Bacteroides sp.]